MVGSLTLWVGVNAGSWSIEEEVVSDMLVVREELLSCSATDNAEGHREDFINTVSNELGYDCKTVSVSTEGIELNVGQNEPETMPVESAELTSISTSINDLNVDATEVVQVTASYNEKVYTLPVQDVKDFKSGATIQVDQVPIYLGSIQNIISQDISYPEWDTRKRFRDILILEDILVDQLGVSKSVASAIIGNVCYEDSFASLTNSKASLSNESEADSRLGSGSRGFGIAQWTSKYRQDKLNEYYQTASKDLDWETAAVVAECMYLYNELRASELLGDMSVEQDLENITGKFGYEYLRYANKYNEWSIVNGKYRSNGSPRYNYALRVYRYMCSE